MSLCVSLHIYCLWIYVTGRTVSLHLRNTRLRRCVRGCTFQGRTSMHELARVLKSQGGPPLTSMSIAFPAPEVPWMKAVGSHGHRCAGEDERMQKRHAAAPDDSLALDLASSLVRSASKLEPDASGA